VSTVDLRLAGGRCGRRPKGRFSIPPRRAAFSRCSPDPGPPKSSGGPDRMLTGLPDRDNINDGLTPETPADSDIGRLPPVGQGSPRRGFKAGEPCPTGMAESVGAPQRLAGWFTPPDRRGVPGDPPVRPASFGPSRYLTIRSGKLGWLCCTAVQVMIGRATKSGLEQQVSLWQFIQLN